MSLYQNLISHWKFDEAFAPDVSASDSHGSNTLTSFNNTSVTTGKKGNARDFESSSSNYLSRTSNTSLQTGDIDFTLSAWINPETLGGNIVSKWLDTGSNFEYVLYIISNRIELAVSSNGVSFATVRATTFGDLSISTWYHVTGWHDATNNIIGVSVNAVETTASYSSGVKAGSADFRIGNDDREVAYFDGLIDEVSFWKRTLTSGERLLLYNGGVGRTYEEYGIVPVFMNHYRQQGIC